MHSMEMQTTIDRLLDRHSFDAVHCEFPMMGVYDFTSATIKILDAHNVEHDNFRRWAHYGPSMVRRLHYRCEWLKVKEEELGVCRKQDGILITSARDKALLDIDVPDVPKYLIPNGVDTSYFAPADDASEPHSLVFSGMMGYLPNYDGVLHFLDEIFPKIQRCIPDVKIYVVGKQPPKALVDRADNNVIVTGYVDDVRPYLRKASVYVVPLRMGSGTRLKVLEAMAMHKPIVTTAIGCEGIEAVDGESVLIADHPELFAERVVELFNDRAVRQRLVRAGREVVDTKYDWTIIGTRLVEVYQSLWKPRLMESPHHQGRLALNRWAERMTQLRT
jgi:glycosyltransferase involved in cell wall biosynthesis